MNERFMKAMKRIIVPVILVLIWELAAVPVLYAQITGRQSTRGIGPKPNGWSAEARQEPQIGSRHNTWLQGDKRQQEQLMGCYRLSSDLEHRVRDVRKSLSKVPVDWPVVRNQYGDIKKGFLLLAAEHEEFVAGLNNGQSSWWETRLRKITVVEFKLEARMGAMEGELKENRPTPDKVRSLFTDLVVQIGEWKDCYAQMGADMDIENLDQKSTGTIRGLSGTQNP